MKNDKFQKTGNIDKTFHEILEKMQPLPVKYVMRTVPEHEIVAINSIDDLSNYTRYEFTDISLIPKVY